MAEGFVESIRDESIGDESIGVRSIGNVESTDNKLNDDDTGQGLILVPFSAQFKLFCP